MDDLQRILEESLDEKLNMIVLSNSRDEAVAAKAKIRPVLIGGALKFQETKYQGTKVFHENFTKDELSVRLREQLNSLFRQCEIAAQELSATVLVSKKGKMTVKVRRGNKDAKNRLSGNPNPGSLNAGEQTARVAQDSLAHNRVKQYILPEGEPVDFLIGLGVQMPDGKIN